MLFVPAHISMPALQQKIDAAQGTLQSGRYRIVVRVTGPEGTRTVITRISGEDVFTQNGSGPFATARGVFQGRRWYQDVNGMVIFRPARTDAASKAQPPELLGMTDGTPAQYVVQRRDGEDTIRDYYDAATFLLDEEDVRGSDGSREIVNYSDYRNVFGKQRAFRVSYGDGNAANARTQQTMSFERDQSNAALEPPPARMLYTLARGQNVKLPVRFTRGGIIMPLAIGDQTLDFLLDTGSSSLNIDAGALARLHLQSHLAFREHVAGDIDVGRALVPSASVAGIRMQNVAFDVIPENSQSHVGLIGCDFLVPAIVAIDFHDKTVTLMSPDTFDPKALGAVAVPADYDDCAPHVTASFNGQRGRFLIDTGASDTVLNMPFADRLSGKQMISAQYFPEIGGVGGSVESQAYYVPDVVVGPVKFQTASVFVPLQRDWLVNSGEDGIIGRDVLSAFTLYFDYANNVIYFKVHPAKP